MMVINRHGWIATSSRPLTWMLTSPTRPSIFVVRNLDIYWMTNMVTFLYSIPNYRFTTIWSNMFLYIQRFTHWWWRDLKTTLIHTANIVYAPCCNKQISNAAASVEWCSFIKHFSNIVYPPIPFLKTMKKKCSIK
jgi:hypothetical protein